MEQTITRADIIADITSNFKISRPQAAEVFESVIEEICQSLAKGDVVKLSSFGTFSIRKKKERLGRNPRTGVTAKITARQVVSFKASPIFKKTVRA